MPLKHLQHIKHRDLLLQHPYETPATYSLKHLKYLKYTLATCGRGGRGRLITASGRENQQHGPCSWVPLAWPRTDLRRATAPRAPAEVGGAPDGAGGTTGARSETERAGRVRREERKANITGWGCVQEDGCGGKSGVKRTDGRTTP